MKKKVLFLCTHNSCRSQMAEGLANHYLGERIQAYSAGTEATTVNPQAIAVMQEIGIDISGHFSKTIDQLGGVRFDVVITLCGDAQENCPLFFGGTEIAHIGFPDPSRATGTGEEVRASFRTVRDDIRAKLMEFFAV